MRCICVTYEMSRAQKIVGMALDQNQFNHKPYDISIDDSQMCTSPLCVTEAIPCGSNALLQTEEPELLEENLIFDSDDSILDPDYLPESNEFNMEINQDLPYTPNSPLVYNSDTPIPLPWNDEDTKPIQEINKRARRPKKGRKIKFGDCNREERKRRKYTNKAYVTSKNKQKFPKTFIDYNCHCHMKCMEQISKNSRENAFKTYHELGSYNAQTMFILANVQQVPKKRSYVMVTSGSSNVARNKPKNFSRIYKLSGIKVCREMFVKTLGISPQRVTVCLKKNVVGSSLADQRGKKQGGWNKTLPEDLQIVIDHIDSIPRYISHYRRSTCNDALFLQADMTLKKLYELYTTLLTEKFPDRKRVSFSKYKEVYLTNFNLRTKSLHKDTCLKCDIFKIKLKNAVTEDEKETITKQHNTHITLYQELRKIMKEDLTESKLSIKQECITFDLQQTLPLPRIPTNIVFYKSQLWVYNCGVHSGSDDKGYCYVWVEGEAGRGAQEAGSCLMYHLNNFLKPGVENLILWSDSCGGQNRNIKIVLLLKLVLANHPTLQTISHRFLEPGHTYLPNDTDFGKIESGLKLQQRIYTPEEYMNVMRSCQTKNPFTVTRMDPQHFYSTAKLEKLIVNRKKGTNEERINWLKTKEILLKRENVYSIYMRSSFTTEFVEVNIKKKTVRGRCSDQLLSMENLLPLWPNGKEISTAKLKDLQSLLDLIPRDCRDIYTQLEGEKVEVE